MNTIFLFNAWLVALTLISSVRPNPSTTIADVPENASVFVSHDYGATWTRRDNGFPQNDGVNAIVLHNNRVIAGTDKNGIWAMDKNGWYNLSTGLPKAARVLSLLSYKQVLFAGLFQGGLYYSTDEGSTWQLLGSDAKANVRALSGQNGIVYAGTNNGIYSVDIRAGWRQLFGGYQINTLTGNDAYVYAGTHQGAIRSQDGITWEHIYETSAIQQIGLSQDEIRLMDYSGNVYRASQDRPLFIEEDLFLPHMYFRLTPSSPKILGEWSDLSFVNGGSRRGLPAKTPLSILLRTPFGLLATKSPAPVGC